MNSNSKKFKIECHSGSVLSVWRVKLKKIRVAVWYGCISAWLWYRYYSCDIAFTQQFNSTSVQIHSVFKSPLLCRTTSFRHGLKSYVDRLTAEPPLLILKHHVRTSNEGTLSCFIKSLLYYCIKSCVLCIECYERDIDWTSVSTCIWCSIHSSDQSHIHNKH